MKTSIILTLLVLDSSLFFIGPANAQLADSPWPMFQHDARHTGQSPYVGPDNPVLKWKYHPDISFMDDPVVDKEGNIYFWNYDGTLRVLNPDKTEKWRYTWKYTIGDENPGKPVVSNDGAIYFATKYYIYALNPSGHLKWTFRSETPIYHTSLFGNEGELYIYRNEKKPSTAYAPKNFFGALSTAGKLKWQILLEGSLNDTPAIAPDGSIILPVTKYRLNTYFGTYYIASGYSIYSLNPDGTIKWFLDGSNEYNDGIGSPVVDKNGVIYVVTSTDERTINAINPDGTTMWQIDTIDTIIYNLVVDDNSTLYVTYKEIYGEYGNHYLKAIDADGNEKWTRDYGGVVIADDGTIYTTKVIGIKDPYVSYLIALNQDGTSKWEFQIDGPFTAGPSIAQDGTIYVGGYDFYAVSPDGQELWRAAVDDYVTITPILNQDGSIYVRGVSYFYKFSSEGNALWSLKCVGGFYKTTPVIGSDGTIYAGSSDHFLYAISPDGTEKWNVNQHYKINGCPAIGADGTVYSGSDLFYAINQDQSIKWTFDSGEINHYFDENSAAIDADGNIYISATDTSRLYSFKPDGEKRWTAYIGESSPAISDDGKVYITGYKGLFSVNSSDGSLNWSYNLNTPYSSHLAPSIGSGGTVYTSSREYDGGTYWYYLCAFNPDGTIKWKFETGKSRANAPLVDQDDTIYFGTNYSLYAVNPDGTLKWQYKGEDPDNPQGFLPRIIDGNGVIYALSNLAIYAINPDGSLKWTFEIPYDRESSPALGADGTLYIGGDDWYLCAIGESKTPQVDIYANNSSFTIGDTVNISVKVENPTERSVDLYTAVMLNGILFWYPIWNETPHVTEIGNGIWDDVIASFSITSDIPRESYNFYAAVTSRVTGDVIDFDAVTIDINK